MSLHETAMGGDGDHDQSEIFKAPQAAEVSRGGESLFQKAVKHPLLSRAFRIFGVSAAIGTSLVPQSLGAVTGKALAEEFSQGKQGISVVDEDGLPSQKSLEENMAIVKELQNSSTNSGGVISSPEISASQSATDTLKSLILSDKEVQDLYKEWQEQGVNHPEIVTTSYIEKEGRVAEMLSLVVKRDTAKKTGAKKAFIYRTAEPFEPYKATTLNAIEGMENPLAFAVSPDGKYGLMGGENPIRSNSAKLFAFFDGWNNPVEVDWPYPAAGGIVDILPLPGTDSFVVNLGNFEGGISMYIADVDYASKKVNVRKTNIVGSTYQPRVTWVDHTTKDFRIVAAGSFNTELRRGGPIIYRGNYDTGVISAEQISEGVVDKKTVGLPEFYSVTLYKDKSGEEYLMGISWFTDSLYNINLRTKEMSITNYSKITDNRGLTNYLPGSFMAGRNLPPIPVFDTAGNIGVWLGGGRTSTLFSTQVAGLAYFTLGVDWVKNPDSAAYYELVPDRVSMVVQMQLKKFGEGLAIDMNIWEFARGMVPTNHNGTPIAGVKPVFTNKGEGSDPVSKRVYLPVTAKNFGVGW